MSTAFDRYRAGELPANLTPAEALDLADAIKRHGWDAYTNPRHPSHKEVSADVRTLHEMAAAASPEGSQPV